MSTARSLPAPVTGHRWNVVLIVPIEGQVVAIARDFDPVDVNLPGGSDEYLDKNPMDTARRELLEETGLQSVEMTLVDCWKNKDSSVTYAYQVTLFAGKLRSSSAGKTFLAAPKQLCREECTFAGKNTRLLKRLKNL